MKSDWWNDFKDRESAANVETRRKQWVFYFCNYFGCVAIIFFASQHLNSDDDFLKWTLYLTAAFLVTNVLTSYLFDLLNLFCFNTGLVISIFMLFLLYGGGHENTALYWLYPFPLVLFVLLGYRLAAIFNLVLLGLFAFLLFNPELIAANYPHADKTRFLSSYFCTVVIIYITEFFRVRSHFELSRINQDRQLQANTDQLSQLPNRRFIDSSLLPDISQHPDKYFPLAVVMADIDHFKQVNDKFGHDIGDEVLRHVAGLFQNTIRSSDVVARTGGEEFLFFFPQTGAEVAHKVAENIRQVLENSPIALQAHDLNLTSSFGVACATQNDDLTQTLKQADENLYVAKSQGRNQVV
ncbi:GGDEF domain-containing protein [Saccharobesus litoralis]|uniref:diguanylate cyclase n=1 Tax=Saccharobesus litoralis TaxID=2172099 RepID=A0A2S0VPT0_9ALTE|nr:GGDEF domain-containing protein [Saccharobesus litoralis]AWB66227.1 GGDEF domain-containing protein [Saccharobesus litoralis]